MKTRWEHSIPKEHAEDLNPQPAKSQIYSSFSQSNQERSNKCRHLLVDRETSVPFLSPSKYMWRFLIIWRLLKCREIYNCYILTLMRLNIFLIFNLKKTLHFVEQWKSENWNKQNLGAHPSLVINVICLLVDFFNSSWRDIQGSWLMIYVMLHIIMSSITVLIPPFMHLSAVSSLTLIYSLTSCIPTLLLPSPYCIQVIWREK